MYPSPRRSNPSFPAASLLANLSGTGTSRSTDIVLYFVRTRDNKPLKDFSRDLPRGIPAAAPADDGAPAELNGEKRFR
jgi:hypothetical protein